MKQKTITLYTIDELTPEVKEKVIEEHRSFNTEFSYWWTPIEENFIEELTKQGYSNIKIAFSGFWSQGDGASFTAQLDICKWLDYNKLSEKYKKAYTYAQEYGECSIIEIVRVSNHYSHENTCDAQLYGCDPSLYNDEKYSNLDNDEIMRQLNEIQELVEDERKTLSKKLYRDLEKYYEELTSDEAVLESLRANDYDFLENGQIF